MTRPIEIEPPLSAKALLPGATFADAFQIEMSGPSIDAVTASERVFKTVPAWISGLLALRDVLVRPFGLKGASEAQNSSRDRMGFFPCISRSPERIVLGFDDKHLDFRIVVDASPGQRQVTATTVVRPQNVFGRIYLSGVMPFHKRIVPSMLARAQTGPDTGASAG